MRARWLLMRSIKSRRKRYEACDDAVGLDLPCAAGRVAVLECPRHSIHYRSRSTPFISMYKLKAPP